MKKISALLLCSCAWLLVNAQTTRIQIKKYDGKSCANITVFADGIALGNTAMDGTLTVAEKLTANSSYRLVLDSIDLDYELESVQTINTQILLITFLVVPQKVEEVMISATRANVNTPTTISTLEKADILVQNTGRDIPMLLQFQPSVVSTSDAGSGIGYTGFRIRGSDASRTNVTINGVPINDAESQGTFWVNMPDLASSVQSIQIQRGVGGSTNGAGAFGATVNVQTLSGYKTYGFLANTFGSYNTRKTTLAGGTGLINDHWTIDMRLSSVYSNGYIQRASSDLSSYFLSIGYMGEKWSLKILNFSGTEKTYQAWNGIPIEKLKNDGSDSGQQALTNHYYRNQGYLYNDINDSINLFQSNNRTYNTFQYKNQTDNYRQSHYHLYFTRKIKTRSVFNATLYYTRGKGYFEEYRAGEAYSLYKIPNFISGSDTLTNTDIIRRRWLDNGLAGMILNYSWNRQKWSIITGAAYSRYKGDHYGQLLWLRLNPGVPYEHTYYSATGDKVDGTIYTKINYDFTKKINGYLDLQFRRVAHVGHGYDNNQRKINFDAIHHFFNPKAGITYTINGLSAFYGSVCVANREPSRSDYTDNPLNEVPKAEKLTDFELGYKKNASRYAVQANVFYMQYLNQLVPTGTVNDVGTPLRSNVNNSYRRGIELQGNYRLFSQISIGGNVTFSQNKIKTLHAKSPNYVNGEYETDTLKNVNIAYSPAVVAAFQLLFHFKNNFNIRWVHKYISRQYLDNTGNESRSIDPYYFSEIWINKTWILKKGLQLEIQLQCLNVFSNLYNNNGYAYTYYTGTTSNTYQVQEVSIFPSAPRNFLGNIILRF